MVKKVIFLIFVNGFIPFLSEAATYTAKVPGGEWDNTNSWVGGVVPPYGVSGNDVIIPNGSTITITGKTITYTGILNITIQNGGELGLYYTPFPSFAQANLVLGAGSLITIESGGNLTTSASGFWVQIFIGGILVWDPYYAPDPALSDPNPVPGPATIDMSGLPIDLIYFRASKSKDQASLSWTTASEENFDYFEIQRAVGSTDFEKISEIGGAGKDSYKLLEYQFTDEKPLNGINYYRLKSIDLDGTFEYSLIQVLKFDFVSRFQVYPNPTVGQEMNILIDDVESHYSYVVYDNMGLLVHQGKILGGDETYDLPDLKSGVYHVRLIGRGDNPVTKLVVH